MTTIIRIGKPLRLSTHSPPNPEEDDGNHNPGGVETKDLKEVISKLIPDSTGKGIEKACPSTYSLRDVFVRKVRMLKKSVFKLGKLVELHSEGGSSGKAAGDETGTKVEQAEAYESPVQESA